MNEIAGIIEDTIARSEPIKQLRADINFLRTDIAFIKSLIDGIQNRPRIEPEPTKETLNGKV